MSIRCFQLLFWLMLLQYIVICVYILTYSSLFHRLEEIWVKFSQKFLKLIKFHENKSNLPLQALIFSK